MPRFSEMTQIRTATAHPSCDPEGGGRADAVAARENKKRARGLAAAVRDCLDGKVSGVRRFEKPE